MFAFIIAGIYSHSGYSQHGINNRIGMISIPSYNIDMPHSYLCTGVLIVMAINMGFSGVSGVLNTFPKEKIIVNRERATGAYDCLTYFTAKYIVEVGTY